MRNPVTTFVALLLALVFLSACGQKGPLFLPGNPSKIRVDPPVEEPREETDDEDDDENDPITNRS